jgi:hypothetical protein
LPISHAIRARLFVGALAAVAVLAIAGSSGAQAGGFADFRSIARTEVAPVSMFADKQVIAYYGTPLAPGLGILGLYPPEEMAQRLVRETERYDRLNGDRGTVGAIHLIYSIALDSPGPHGMYVNYLPDSTVNRYVRLAERHDLQLILDFQIGRNDIPSEIRKVDRFLKHPRVHVAVDPEYAVGPHGIPILTPGVITGGEMNEMQEHVAGIVEEHDLPPKMIVIHQFMDKTVVNGSEAKRYDGVEIVLNMDAFGDEKPKIDKYRAYSNLPYAHRMGYNIFLKQDRPVATPEKVLALQPSPDFIIYQ